MSDDAAASARARASFFLTFRVTDETRFEYLRVSLESSLAHLRGPYDCHIIDASPEPWASRARALLEGQRGVRLDYQQSRARMPQAWAELLERCETPYAFSLFDDQPIRHLTDEWLAAYCDAFDAAPELDVGLMVLGWPVRSVIDHGQRLIRSVPSVNTFANDFRELERCFVAREHVVHVLRRYPFTLKFFFNNMFVRREPYLKNLRWFLDRDPDATAAKMEIGSDVVPRPFERLVYLYSPNHVLDIDGAHTASSARGGGFARSASHQQYLALRAGYDSESVAYVGAPPAALLESVRHGEPAPYIRWLRREYAKRLRTFFGAIPGELSVPYLIRNLSDRALWKFMRYRVQARVPPGIW